MERYALVITCSELYVELRGTSLYLTTTNTSIPHHLFCSSLSYYSHRPATHFTHNYALILTRYLLLSERTALSQLGLTTGWGAQNSGTVVTGDSGLCVREHSGDVQASLALDVHEVGSWGLDQGLQFVLLSLGGWVWVQQVLN